MIFKSLKPDLDSQKITETYLVIHMKEKMLSYVEQQHLGQAHVSMCSISSFHYSL